MSRYIGASLVAQMVKNLPATWETWVRSLGQEDPLEEGMAIHSSILAWRIPWIEEPGRATVHRVSKSQTRLKQLSTQALRNTGQTRRHFARLIAFLLYFLTSSASLFYKRNRHPDPNKMVPCLSIIGLSCSKQTKLGNIHISNQWLSTEYTQFYPSWYLAMSRDILGCHNIGGGWELLLASTMHQRVPKDWSRCKHQ